MREDVPDAQAKGTKLDAPDVQCKGASGFPWLVGKQDGPRAEESSKEKKDKKDKKDKKAEKKEKKEKRKRKEKEMEQRLREKLLQEMQAGVHGSVAPTKKGSDQKPKVSEEDVNAGKGSEAP